MQKADEICCLEELLSAGTHPRAAESQQPGFSTVLVSLCRTKDFALHGGQVLNEPEIIKFLLSRCADNLVVFGKPE